MHILYPFAKRFIAGEDLHTALRNIKSLNQSGYLSTIDVLGENIHTEEQATAAKQEYLDLLAAVADCDFPLDLSVKLTQMGLDISKSICVNNLDEIISAGPNHTVRLDMEGSDYTQPTVAVCQELHEKHKNIGIVLQAYLFRTKGDVENMVNNGISVRICKGAYKEPAEIAYQSMDDIRESFLTSARLLLKEGNQPAVATHDEYLIRELNAFISKEGIDKNSFYFEMLYGVRRDLQKQLLDKGYRVRVYVPYGKSWLPYTLRRLTERKENILFVIKNLFRETLGLGKIH